MILNEDAEIKNPIAKYQKEATRRNNKRKLMNDTLNSENTDQVDLVALNKDI
jgi:hypothetical protein